MVEVVWRGDLGGVSDGWGSVSDGRGSVSVG